MKMKTGTAKKLAGYMKDLIEIGELENEIMNQKLQELKYPIRPCRAGCVDVQEIWAGKAVITDKFEVMKAFI